MVRFRKRWWAQDPLPDGRVAFRCLQCNEVLPYQNPRLCRKYHWPGFQDGARCQGEIARLRGELDLRNREVLVMFGDENAHRPRQPHYGRVMYEVQDLVYQRRGRVQTMWRVQFEDGEEFELNYEEITEGLQRIAALPPQNPIVVPVDRGEEGRPGDLRAPAPQADPDGEGREDEDDEDEPLFEDDENELEELFLSSDDEIDQDDEAYLRGPVARGRETNILTHILRTLRDKRGAQTNQSVIQSFNRVSEDFGTKLPKTWDSLLKLLKVCTCSLYTYVSQAPYV